LEGVHAFPSVQFLTSHTSSFTVRFPHRVMAEPSCVLDCQYLRFLSYYRPCLNKNVPPLTCYNVDMHGLITIIFGTSITEIVGNQNVLYFPTSPNLCFCTTWGNRKSEKCIFSLKCCMLFTKNSKHIKISVQLNHHSLSKRLTGCTRQDLYNPAVCYPHGLC